MPERLAITSGSVEKIGEEGSHIKQTTVKSGQDEEKTERQVDIPDHRTGLDNIAGLLTDESCGVITDPNEIFAVGHRVVHGGERFSQPTLINDEVLANIESLSFLAPLHNPANLEGIKVSKEVFPQAKQVAIFDTAFHQSLPDYAYRYAIPNWLYDEHAVRAYGFHGTSHRYVARRAADLLETSEENLNLITIHLGNGCSMAAVKGGKSIDTSMGLSPLAGLVMGTRSGDIDPSIYNFLESRLDMDFKAVDKMLNKESGLKGLTGENDLRAVIEHAESGDKNAQLALDVYTYRIKKYIGAYAAALGKLDAIVFTAGVGENSALIREKVCTNLDVLGIHIDKEKNEASDRTERLINDSQSRVTILVIPTNEELEIADQTQQLLQHVNG